MFPVISSMLKLRHLFITMIFLGLIIAEALPIWSKLATPAQSERRLTSDEQNLIMSILQRPDDTTPSYTGAFLDFDAPADPSTIVRDALISSRLIGSTSQMYSLDPTTNSADNATIGDIIANLLPPTGSELYYAYQDGGRAWYEKGLNVLVIFPGDIIRSFDKSTGKETTWMQDRLAYPPISDPAAYTNYQKNYRAIIVAETTQWVLMEFPSGGLVKVMRPQYTSATAGGTIYGLPDILPGYGN